jgi:tetratricopeptide (TPR) repeat protein
MLGMRKLAVLGTFLVAITLSVSIEAQTPNNQAVPETRQPQAASLSEALDRGVAAYKDGHYDDAIELFRQAVALDAASSQARLYLGSAYAQEVVPALNTPENLANAKNAIDNLKMVPEGGPNYLAALKSIASVYSNVNRMNEAREAQLQALKIEPSDAEPHYTVGVLDYTEAYKNARTVLAANGLQDDGVGNAKLAVSPCLELRDKNSALISDGIDHLTRAIELNPKYDDAMAYMNLVYRRRADLSCGDESIRAADIAQADQWVQRAIATRKQNDAASSPPK